MTKHPRKKKLPSHRRWAFRYLSGRVIDILFKVVVLVDRFDNWWT
jgi:hypothetical protein